MLAKSYRENIIEAGCDEAGRGCLAGPVVCASVILPKEGLDHPLLNDSKQISEKKRTELRPIIEEQALAWSVVFIDPAEIDEINILNASIKGMAQATLNLSITPDLLLVDGNRFHKFDIEHICMIKGDGRFQSIAAASVLAKTYRDEFMEKIHDEFPHFNWKRNKGYPTKEHRAAIFSKGKTVYHRNTFKLLSDDQLKLQL